MDIQQQIQTQLTENPIVLYMKGTPTFPMCGFSGKAIAILRQCGITSFLAVNVLENETIREGIKIYGNWPTIPQLYIRGKLIGGSDIITQSYESGELQKALADI